MGSRRRRDGIVRIRLTRHKSGEQHEILIDEEDRDLVLGSGYTWWVMKEPDGRFVAVTKYIRYGERHQLRMQHLIMGVQSTVDLVIHLDYNSLNNRRSNLRIATRSQTRLHSRPTAGGASPYKGVTWEGRRNTWRARITHEGKWVALGNFKTQEEAARAYDQRVWDLHGEFAYLNFPDLVDRSKTTAALF